VRGTGSSEGTFAGEADSLEPLGETYGPGFQETSRVGRTVVDISPPYEPGQTFRVLYQDIAGGRHGTEFRVDGNWRRGRVVLRSRFLGELILEDVPSWIREREAIVTSIV
jgi:hypothetical protein